MNANCASDAKVSLALGFKNTRKEDSYLKSATPFHQVNGPVEVARIDAKDIDECTIWIINMTVTAIGLVIAIAGACFSAPKFYQAFLQVYQNNPRLAAAIRHALGQVIMTNQSLPSAVLTIVGVVYAAGVLGGIFFKAFTSNYYMLAYTVVSVMGTLLSIFVTGGATILFFLVKIAANIVCIVYVLSQRPPNCPS